MSITEASPEEDTGLSLVNRLALLVADYGSEEGHEDNYIEATDKFASYSKDVLLRIDALLKKFSLEQRRRLAFDLGGRRILTQRQAISYLTILEGASDLSGLPYIFSSPDAVVLYDGLKIMSKNISEVDRKRRSTPLVMNSPRSVKEQQAVFRFLVQIFGSPHYTHICHPEYNDSYTGIVIGDQRLYNAIIESPEDVDLMVHVIKSHDVHDADVIKELITVAREENIPEPLHDGCL